ncbi:CBS domain-containing protein, partial [Klebsiella pneumoniae]|nr:CBS domain-containing protein [Klebsiella pneumoniae]
LSHVGHAPCAVPVVNEEQQYIGIISKRMLLQALQTPLSDLLSHVGHAPCAVPVVNEEQQYIGIISKRMLLQAL